MNNFLNNDSERIVAIVDDISLTESEYRLIEDDISIGKSVRRKEDGTIETFFEPFRETEQQIDALKQELYKCKEDVEQVDLFGMERSDYAIKKARCAEIVRSLRELTVLFDEQLAAFDAKCKEREKRIEEERLEYMRQFEETKQDN